MIDPGETCDKARTSTAGGCPSMCRDGIACTADLMVGSPDTCNVSCAFMPISACANGDGCCPAGCTGANDSDCSASCGNNMVDARETCDGNCLSSCDDSNGCTTDTTYGSAATCSLACGYQLKSGCSSGDGCCPRGCTNATDDDCSSTCGNGRVDAKETCDGNCPTSCEDNERCTVDVLTGSAETCNVACARQTITACAGGDGCCPAGCTMATDSDCTAPATCGNGRVDQGEKCDGNCPTSCPSEVPCMRGMLVGNAAQCSAECRYTAITMCGPMDRCCPQGCTSDPDCTASAGNVGDACTSAGDCTSVGSGANCFRDGFPGGYCTLFCTSDPCPSGSRCEGMSFMCFKECGSGVSCRPGYRCDTRLDAQERPFWACVPAP